MAATERPRTAFGGCNYAMADQPRRRRRILLKTMPILLLYFLLAIVDAVRKTPGQGKIYGLWPRRELPRFIEITDDQEAQTELEKPASRLEFLILQISNL